MTLEVSPMMEKSSTSGILKGLRWFPGVFTGLRTLNNMNMAPNDTPSCKEKLPMTSLSHTKKHWFLKTNLKREVETIDKRLIAHRDLPLK